MGSREDDGSERRTVIERLAASVGLAKLIGLSTTSMEPTYSVINRLRHIHEAPLINLRHSLWWIRKTFFTKPRSITPAFLVDMTKPEIVSLFGRNHFEPGWELSYNYLGEVLNVRRVEYVDDGPYDWWQVHIRGYLHEDGGIELTAHYETDPSEHPDAHVQLHGLDVEYGMGVVQRILDDEEIEYHYLDPDRLHVDLGQNTTGTSA